jgi:hypothetical protein
MPVIPANLGGKDWEDHGSEPAQAKSLQDPISTNKSQVWRCMPVIPSYRGSTNRKTVVQANPGINGKSYSKSN